METRFFTHVIILGGSYCEGKRIALHYVLDSNNKTDFLKDIMEEIKTRLGTLQNVSTRMIMTEDKSWQSVVDDDSYYDDVVVCDSVDSFVNPVIKDTTLSSVDIAKYITSKFKRGVVYLALQKLSYLCHAEYLAEYGRPLFSDAVFAFEKGPVCSEIYHYYKDEKIRMYDSVSDDGCSESFRGRLLKVPFGAEKLRIIDSVIEKYRDYNADQLVDITHRKDSPWDRSYEENSMFVTIDNDVIRKFHYIEQ